MGLLDSFGFDNIELWRSEEMQLVQVCGWIGCRQVFVYMHVSRAQSGGGILC